MKKKKNKKKKKSLPRESKKIKENYQEKMLGKLDQRAEYEANVTEEENPE